MKVVETIDNVPPEDTSNHSSEEEARYAIGVNAGWTVDHSVGVGTAVRFENLSP